MDKAAGPLIAVVGMVREARIIAGEGVTVVVGGGNSVMLKQRLAAALQDAAGQGRPFSRLISFGICGALDPTLRVGDLVVGSAVIEGERRWRCDEAWAERLRRALPGARSGVVAGSDVVLGSIAAKQAVAARTGAEVIDMESHIAAELAEPLGLALAVVRVVSDAADQSLPPAALVGLGPGGGPDIRAVLRSLAAEPRQLPSLLRIARDVSVAFRALERAPKAWLPGSMAES